MLVGVDYCQRLDRHYTSFSHIRAWSRKTLWASWRLRTRFSLALAMRVPCLGAYFLRGHTSIAEFCRLNETRKPVMGVYPTLLGLSAPQIMGKQLAETEACFLLGMPHQMLGKFWARLAPCIAAIKLSIRVIGCTRTLPRAGVPA